MPDMQIQGAYLVMPLSIGRERGQQPLALRENDRAESRSRSPITPPPRRRSDRGHERPTEPSGSWDDNKDKDGGWSSNRQHQSWDYQDSSQNQGSWSASSWQGQDWRAGSWNSGGSSQWQRPSWGRGGKAKGKGKGKGRGRGKGRGSWQQWGSWRPNQASDAVASGTDDNWGSWSSNGPAGAVAKAPPPAKNSENNEEEAAPATAPTAAPGVMDFGDDEESDIWNLAIENATLDPDRVPAVNEAWTSGDICVIPTPPDDQVATAAQRFVEIHPALSELPRTLGHRLFRAMVMADISPDPQKEVLLWEGVGWQATYVPLAIKPHTYFRDAAAEGALNYLTFGHGTDWKSLPYILQEGLVRPQSWEKGGLPSSGFFTQALNQAWSDHAIKHCVRRALAIPKGQQGPIILGQAVTPLPPAVISGGGNWRLHAACRVAGAARSPEAYCIKSCFATLEGVAIVQPF